MNNTLPTPARPTVIIQILTFLLPLLALNSSFGVGLCSFAFLLAAIIYRRQAWPALMSHMREVRGVLLAFGVLLALAILGMLLSPDGRLRDLEKPSRMLAAATVMLSVLACRPKRKALWWGLIVGACASAVFIAYQRWALGLYRPGGLINSITFGDIVMCMALMCLAAMLEFPGRSAFWPGLGALAGLTGSIASGTRGGWVAIALAIVLLIRYGHVLRGRLRKGLALLALGLMVSAYFIPQAGVRERIDEGISNVRDYFDGGDTHTSLGIRLELWRSAATLIQRHPLLGATPNQVRAELTGLVAEHKAHPYVLDAEHFHNDILQSLVMGGVVGLVAWAATLLAPFLFFRRMLHVPGPERPALAAPALAGMLLVLSYFSFGLTEVIFWSVRSSIFYALMLFLLMGLCLNAQREGEALNAAARRSAARTDSTRHGEGAAA